MQLKSLEDTQNLSSKISKIVGASDIIFLYGEIGVGKTTFVRFFINHLEAENGIKKSDVLSPTFNIVYEYDIGDINKDYSINILDIIELINEILSGGTSGIEFYLSDLNNDGILNIQDLISLVNLILSMED
jgi:GTPase SAR1 family protein